MWAAIDQLSLAAERTAPFFIITHSLGSKIAADALVEVPRTRDDVLTSALGRTYQIFMEANQLPILVLGNGRVSAHLEASRVGAAASMQALVARIAEGRGRIPGPHVLKDEPIVVVAFNDPNDLLSWGLHDSAVQFEGAKTVDVWVSNAPTWFGFLENPLVGHVGYATNPAVARLIA